MKYMLLMSATKTDLQSFGTSLGPDDIRAHIKFTKRGARVLLCNLENRIEAVFVVAKLSMLFPVYPDENAAIAGCASAKE